MKFKVGKFYPTTTDYQPATPYQGTIHNAPCKPVTKCELGKWYNVVTSIPADHPYKHLWCAAKSGKRIFSGATDPNNGNHVVETQFYTPLSLDYGVWTADDYVSTGSPEWFFHKDWLEEVEMVDLPVVTQPEQENPKPRIPCKATYIDTDTGWGWGPGCPTNDQPLCLTAKVDTPPSKFSPAYRMLCWHDWVSGPDEIRVHRPGRAFFAIVAMFCLSLVLVCNIQTYGLIAGLPALGAWAGVTIAWLVLLDSQERGQFGFGYGPWAEYADSLYVDRICTKCGKMRLDYTKRRKAEDQKMEKLVKATAAAEEKAKSVLAAREAVVSSAQEALKNYVTLANKAG